MNNNFTLYQSLYFLDDKGNETKGIIINIKNDPLKEGIQNIEMAVEGSKRFEKAEAQQEAIALTTNAIEKAIEDPISKENKDGEDVFKENTVDEYSVYIECIKKALESGSKIVEMSKGVFLSWKQYEAHLQNISESANALKKPPKQTVKSFIESLNEYEYGRKFVHDQFKNKDPESELMAKDYYEIINELKKLNNSFEYGSRSGGNPMNIVNKCFDLSDISFNTKPKMETVVLSLKKYKKLKKKVDLYKKNETIFVKQGLFQSAVVYTDNKAVTKITEELICESRKRMISEGKMISLKNWISDNKHGFMGFNFVDPELLLQKIDELNKE